MGDETRHDDEVIEQGEVPKGVKLALWGAAAFMVLIGFTAWVMYG
ncbi:hypothetical protein [Aliiroseovarius sp.]